MHGIVFIGLQASGKSSFFLEKFQNTHLRLNMDMLKTRHREKIILSACIEAKQPIVIDNTNPTVKERLKYISAFKAAKFKVHGYYFESSLAKCLERNKKRDGKQQIPEIGIKGTYNKIEVPSFAEGFDELFYVSIEKNEFVLKEWSDEI